MRSKMLHLDEFYTNVNLLTIYTVVSVSLLLELIT